VRQNTTPTPRTTTDLRDVLVASTDAAVQTWLRDVAGSWDRTEQVDDLTDAEVRRLVALLTPETSRELFDSIDTSSVVTVLSVLSPAVGAGLLDSLDHDRSAEILRRLPADERRDVLDRTGAVRSATLRGLLAWPDDSAGSRMDPTVVSVTQTMTVAEAVETIRDQARTATLDNDEVLVTALPDHRLVGVVSYLDLVLAEPGVVIGDLMDTDVVSVGALADQEVAARLLTEHDLSGIPVVHEGELVGVISVEDVVDILDQEMTEDAERQGGSSPLEVPYLRASPLRLFRKRITWLLMLFLAAMYTGTVMEHFESELEGVVALMFFVPLLIGTGGNTGTQITTTLIRAMAMGQVRMRDMFRVVRKEMATGVLIAATVASVAWVRALVQGVGTDVALTVSLSVVAIVLWTSLVASVLPLVIKKVGIDPAVVSGPLITTVIDGTGLIIYFSIARVVIDQLG
jgi:magnesium transporter